MPTSCAVRSAMNPNSGSTKVRILLYGLAQLWQISAVSSSRPHLNLLQVVHTWYLNSSSSRPGTRRSPREVQTLPPATISLPGAYS